MDCEALDRSDGLAECRGRFTLPGGCIYLDGNSLGAMPSAAPPRSAEVVAKEWGDGLIRSWNEAAWWELPTRLGDKVARLIGADPGEVIVTDSTGINLHKALYAALSLVPERRVIVMESTNFPTDVYIAQGIVRQLGSEYKIRFAEDDELELAINDEVAVVCLTDVHYRSGRILDRDRITALAHSVGAMMVWDLCHSAGAMEVGINACEADFAVGCTYKYLNGGPGSPAFIFAAKRHHGKYAQPLTGWWGHAAPFDFTRDYVPANDIRQMLTGTQPIISMSVLEVGLDLIATQDLAMIRHKSQALTALFIDLVEQRCAGDGFDLQSPRDPVRRGSQVAFNHRQAYAVMQALISRGVIGDFRSPETLRFGFAPLYVSYTDVWDAVEQLVQVMGSKEWRDPVFARRSAVT